MKNVFVNPLYNKFSEDKYDVKFITNINIFDKVIYRDNDDSIKEGIVTGISKKGLYVNTLDKVKGIKYFNIKEVHKRAYERNNNDIVTIFLENMMKTISEVNNIRFENLREFIDYCKKTYDK